MKTLLTEMFFLIIKKNIFARFGYQYFSECFLCYSVNEKYPYKIKTRVDGCDSLKSKKKSHRTW